MMYLLRRFVGLFLLAAFFGCAAVCAQDSGNPTLQDASDFFTNQDWANAIKAYDAIASREPENGLAWLRLGLSYYGSGQHRSALNSFRQSDEIGFAQGFSRFNLARCYSLIGDAGQAFDWLAKAVEAGYSNVAQLQQESAFSALNSDARFAELVQKADMNARPCEFDDKHRQLDFWIGEWDVYNPQGQMVGSNSIHKIQTGCAIQENWTSSGGGTGMSINYLEPDTKLWKQTWVSANGTVIYLEGEFKAGKMQFVSGKNIGINGQSEWSRMTLSPMPDGSVSQLIEQSRDAGKNWYVWFQGKYVRKPNS